MKFLFIVLISVGTLVACSEKTAPSNASEAFEETSSSTDGDMPKADIGEGKVLFIKDCITCHDYASGPHSVAELDNFTKAQVDAVLPKMIQNAKYNKVQARQVTAYIYWELEN